jgi:hypothetical protein
LFASVFLCIHAKKLKLEKNDRNRPVVDVQPSAQQKPEFSLGQSTSMNDDSDGFDGLISEILRVMLPPRWVISSPMFPSQLLSTESSSESSESDSEEMSPVEKDFFLTTVSFRTFIDSNVPFSADVCNRFKGQIQADCLLIVTRNLETQLRYEESRYQDVLAQLQSVNVLCYNTGLQFFLGFCFALFLSSLIRCCCRRRRSCRKNVKQLNETQETKNCESCQSPKVEVPHVQAVAPLQVPPMPQMPQVTVSPGYVYPAYPAFQQSPNFPIVNQTPTNLI